MVTSVNSGLDCIQSCLCTSAFALPNTSFTDLIIDLPPTLFASYTPPSLDQRTTWLLPPRLAHHQVRFLAPHLDFKTIMDAVPTEPGLSNSIDPFADPLDKMGFPNYAVVKIGNVSCPFPLLHIYFGLLSYRSPSRYALAHFTDTIQIPYGATKQEILHFIGREAHEIMSDEENYGTSIHIIMATLR